MKRDNNHISIERNNNYILTERKSKCKLSKMNNKCKLSERNNKCKLNEGNNKSKLMRNCHASNLSNRNWNNNHLMLQGISISCNWHEIINTLMRSLTTIKENWITRQNLSWYNYRSNSCSFRLGHRSLEELLFGTK